MINTTRPDESPASFVLLAHIAQSTVSGEFDCNQRVCGVMINAAQTISGIAAKRVLCVALGAGENKSRHEQT
jgi:hypothetical protein